jgi:hypothetical protein
MMTAQRPQGISGGREGNEGNAIDARHAAALVAANEYDHGGVRLVEQPADYDHRSAGVGFEQPDGFDDEPTGVRLEESNEFDHRPTEVRLEEPERNRLSSEGRIPSSNGVHTTKRYRGQQAREHRFLMNYG